MRATALPLPITFESQRQKIHRFLSLPQLTLSKIWLPILQAWLKAEVESDHVVYIAIDRTTVFILGCMVKLGSILWIYIQL